MNRGITDEEIISREKNNEPKRKQISTVFQLKERELKIIAKKLHVKRKINFIIATKCVTVSLSLLCAIILRASFQQVTFTIDNPNTLTRLRVINFALCFAALSNNRLTETSTIIYSQSTFRRS